MNREGDTFDMYAIGCAVIYAQMLVNHVMWTIEAKSWHWVFIVALIVNFIWFMPLTVNMNNKKAGSPYHMNQWDKVYNVPLLHLTVMLCTFITVLPRFMWITFEHVVAWPQFAKVKSS